MRLPLNWLADYLELPGSPRQIADSFTTIGLMLDKPIEGKVLELEQRLNRADLLSILGCARDLAAFEGLKLQEPKIPLPNLKKLKPEDKIAIKVTTPVVRRFNTRIFKGLKVGPSPKWLRDRLEAYGLDSKNNIVDITNFVMIEYGQPMHAQDLDKLPAQELALRESRAGEKITTLLGTQVELESGMFMISSGHKPCVIGGIVGGLDTGVTKGTTDIILDAGNYDQRHIRTNSRKLKIINESVLRYDKFLDPRLIDPAINRATALILELAGGTVYENEDYYPTPTLAQQMTLTYARLETISGLNIPSNAVKSRLKALGYTIVGENTNGLELEIPYWRTDLEVEDDLISDVLRIGNYNAITTTPLTTPVPTEITPPLYQFEEQLRDLLASLGAQEHITSPLVTADNQPARIKLENALSSEQNALRLTGTETLIPILNTYHKHGINDAVIFEIAKSFQYDNKKPLEIRELTLTSSLDVRPLLTALLSRLGINYHLTPHQKGATILTGKTTLGHLTLNSFTLDTEALLTHQQSYQGITTEFSPKTSLDLSLVLPTEVTFSQVEQIIRKTSPSLLSIKVIEHYTKKNSLLIRLTWTKLKDADKTRVSLIQALKAINVVSRSG